VGGDSHSQPAVKVTLLKLSCFFPNHGSGGLGKLIPDFVDCSLEGGLIKICSLPCSPDFTSVCDPIVMPV